MTKRKKQSLKWAADDVMEFLDIYEQYEILWYISAKNYFNKGARDVAFKQLVKELRKSGFQIPDELSLKKKIKNLKDTYRLEVHKINRSTKNGDINVYKPKLIWFDRASAIMANITSKEAPLSLAASSTTASIQPDELEDVIEEKACIVEISTTSNDYHTETDLHNTRQASPYLETDASEAINETLSRPVNGIDEGPRKLLKREIPRNTTSRLDEFSEAYEIAEIKNSDSDDQYSAFGHHIAAQLRELPIRSFVLLQEKIQSLITQERLAAIELEHPTPHDHPLRHVSNQIYSFPSD